MPINPAHTDQATRAQAGAYLQVSSLSKSFGRFKALDQVSFEIARGEFV